METFELRYFLEVAKSENVHRASEKLRISPGSLSKAISRIEAELKTKLFSRDGRNIRLTEQGKLLKLRAAQILQMEESARMEISGHHGQIQAIFAGSEVILSKMGMAIVGDLQNRFPGMTFEFLACDEAQALEEITDGNAHLALITGEVPHGLSAKTIGEAKFLTVAGPGHPLYARAQAKKPISIEKLLKYSFVSPSRPILGKVGLNQSLDGWRDDQFTRKVTFLTTSLKLLEAIVSNGKTLAYLPDYYAKHLGLLPIQVVGCPYTCVQKIKLVARRPKDTGWLNQLF